LFRSHGEVVKREIYNLAGDDTAMRDAMVSYLKLRYRLMPYIYTMASDIHYNSGTMMRGLVMDFPHDEQVKDIKDQYMFGPALMVAPVTAYGARERKVYMPKGAGWYDFHTGELHKGGTTANVKAPASQIPLFVRAGSVIIMGPVTQYVDEKPEAPLRLVVYAGANGQASLYEDDGVTNAYTRGEASRIPVSYDDKRGIVTIGARAGQYKGMPVTRKFEVQVIRPGTSTWDNLDAAPARTVTYDGKPVTIKL
jgi:alpha-D-xyloside xylohydrolase